MAETPFEEQNAEDSPPETKIRAAMAFLRAHLITGPRPAAEMRDLARASGFTSTTLYKARRRAGVSSRRKGEQWIWSLAAERKQAAMLSQKKDDSH